MEDCLENVFISNGRVKIRCRFGQAGVTHARNNIADLQDCGKIGHVAITMENGIAVVIIIKRPNFLSKGTIDQRNLSSLMVMQLAFFSEVL